MKNRDHDKPVKNLYFTSRFRIKAHILKISAGWIINSVNTCNRYPHLKIFGLHEDSMEI